MEVNAVPDDNTAFSSAKLREFVDGQIKENRDLYPHTGLVEPGSDASEMLSFLESIYDGGPDDSLPARFSETKVGKVLRRKAATDRVGGAVRDLSSYAVGITDHELEGDEMLLVVRLLEQLENHGAPAFVVGSGNPNTGKTNTMSLLAELRRYVMDEYLVLSNSPTWELTDIEVTSCHDLAVALLDNRETSKFVLIDESSTHFDARTYRREIAAQWTPLAKRFAKVGVDVCGNVIHSGKDFHPEAKRLATLAYWKERPDEAEFFGEWPADLDHPVDRLFGGSVTNLEPTSAEYDPDDSAPWKWNLQVDLFAENYDWGELLVALLEHGPAD